MTYFLNKAHVMPKLLLEKYKKGAQGPQRINVPPGEKLHIG